MGGKYYGSGQRRITLGKKSIPRAFLVARATLTSAVGFREFASIAHSRRGRTMALYSVANSALDTDELHLLTKNSEIGLG